MLPDAKGLRGATYTPGHPGRDEDGASGTRVSGCVLARRSKIREATYGLKTGKSIGVWLAA